MQIGQPTIIAAPSPLAVQQPFNALPAVHLLKSSETFPFATEVQHFWMQATDTPTIAGPPEKRRP